MKKDADYIFYELTRSICPKCRKVIDAKVVLRDNKAWAFTAASPSNGGMAGSSSQTLRFGMRGKLG